MDRIPKNMMKLLVSLTSPYARATRIAASVLQLENRLDVLVVNHRGNDDQLLMRNPLGKIPTLVLADEVVLFDSRVIVEYLFQAEGKAEFLFRGADKFLGQTRQALASGLMDCTIAAAVEKRNHDLKDRNLQWIERQEGKLFRTLSYLEDQELTSDFTPLPTADEIFLACALGYLDFIWEKDWKEAHPGLARWMQEFANNVPAFEATRPES